MKHAPRMSRYTGEEPGSEICPQCGKRVAVRADGAGGDLYFEHGPRKNRCPMSRRTVTTSKVENMPMQKREGATKHAHTAGIFRVQRINMASDYAIFTVPRDEEIARITRRGTSLNEANARLLALAPTAPHDCDVPGCPGAENKRKLEAIPELLGALSRAVLALEAWDTQPESERREAIAYARQVWGNAKAQDAKVGGVE